MSDNGSARKTILFGFVALILCGLAVGGVWVIKSRNDSYAAVQQPIVVVGESSQGQEGSDTADEQVVEAEAAQADESATQDGVDSLVAAEAGPQTMPATGGSGDFVLTMVLIMLAVFFCARLWQAKTGVRRLYDAS